jgi:hypothetical protein
MLPWEGIGTEGEQRVKVARAPSAASCAGIRLAVFISFNKLGRFMVSALLEQCSHVNDERHEVCMRVKSEELVEASHDLALPPIRKRTKYHRRFWSGPRADQLALAAPLLGMVEAGSTAMLGKRPPSCLGDPHLRDFDAASAGNYALGLRRRKPGVDEFDHHADREAVRPRLGAAVAGCGGQFECGRRVAGGLRLRALRRGLPTEDIVRAYGTAMCESSRAGRIATGIAIRTA